MSKRVIIIGNGVAGFTAAATIREHDSETEIILMTRETERFYNRMMLSKALSSEELLDDIYMEEDSWYEEHKVTTMLACNVIRIEAKGKNIVYQDLSVPEEKQSNKKMKYDALIYALGAQAFCPDIPGMNQRGVGVLRSIEDAKRAQEQLKEAKHVVVIGGGILGLEMAWQCKAAGKQVSVVEAADRLMEKQLDEEGSTFLQHLLHDEGINVYCGSTVMELVMGQDTARVSGMVIADKVETTIEHEQAVLEEDRAMLQSIPCDMVLVACGITLNTKVALDSGLAVKKGVVVDEKMNTSVEGIFACGDCAESKEEGLGHGLWGEAKAMGETAGKNVVSYLKGENQAAIYHEDRVAFYFRALDTVLFSIGQIEVREESLNEWAIEKGITHQECRDASAGTYEKYYYHKDELIGAILIGVPDKIPKVNERIGVLK